jgi:hypothetical protein
MKCPECKNDTLDVKFTKKHIKFKCSCGNKESVTRQDMMVGLMMQQAALYVYQNSDKLLKILKEVKNKEVL